MHANEYRLGYRADLEGLRAVAIVLVVAAHARVPWLAGGFVGVDVFFVLSGYLITGLLLRELASSGSVRFGEFYVRRLRRLLPGLLAMLLVVGAAATIVLAPGDQQKQASAAGSAAFWLSNLHFAFGHLDYFSSGAESNLFLHTWSLGVEEQFYLVWPALLVWLWGRRARDRPSGLGRLKIGMGVILLASFAACIAMTYLAPRLAFYMMPLRAWQFASGALVWLFWEKGNIFDQGRASRLQVVGWCGLGGILAAAMFLTPNVPYPGGWSMLPTVGAVAIIAAGVRGAGVSRMLAWRPLQALGRVSYAWYLWHWPVLLLARALYSSDAPVIRACAVAVSLVFAVLSYLLVEAPTRHRGIWLVRPRMTVVIALAVMGLASVMCLNWYNHAADLERSPQYRRLASAQADAPVIYRMGCDEWYSSDALRVCGFGAQDAHHTAVLLGDSVAGQWFPAVARAYDKPDWRLLVITKSSCPMVDEPIFYQRIGRMYVECSTWRQRVMKYLAEMKPDTVILGSVATYAFTARQWVGGTERILAPLAAASGHVYLLRSTPRLPFNGPDCLAAHQGRPGWMATLGACSAPAGSANDVVYGWLQQASRPYSNVSVIDLNDQICPGRLCKAERDGLIVFRDSQHMTASFAQSLAQVLSSRVEQKALAGN
ncbi:acyltransferase family protein [Frateuria hangzhouensis]|uniref:acyltransferase family protein n=1 Tax=Frateuria hangzhouensis TaxID=2995589 RepID=UPI002260B4BA|nr:acyltransferase family protein [Frateuria sp. STR12]MCX7513729.1 acyltransferase family protein [Frateuria sp. STR12]